MMTDETTTQDAADSSPDQPTEGQEAGTADVPADADVPASTDEGGPSGEDDDQAGADKDDQATALDAPSDEQPAVPGDDVDDDAPQAEPVGSTEVTEQPVGHIAQHVSASVSAALNAMADEFQSWATRGETPDGSRADMAVIPNVVAALRKRAREA